MRITFDKYEAQAFHQLTGKVLVYRLSHQQIDFLKAVRDTGEGQISIPEWRQLHALIDEPSHYRWGGA